MLARTALRRHNIYRSCLRPQHTPRPTSLTGLCQRNGIRSISFQSGLDACYASTFEGLSALHAVSGLSWAWTLPVAAILIRSAFVLPLELWARQHRLRAIQVTPLVAAWSPILRAEVQRENRALPVRSQRKLFLVAMRRKRQELYKRLGIKTYPSFSPLLQLPIWLVVIETIRKMCGAREGLLGLVTKNLKESNADDGVDAVASSELVQASVSSAVPVEQTLAAEGALWFPDLLVADPQLILPFVLSATMFANVSLNQRQQRAEGTQPTKGSKRVTRILQVMALGIGPVTLAMPSAMLVYWISSSACAMAHHMVTWKLSEKPPTATPCKGPYGMSTGAGD